MKNDTTLAQLGFDQHFEELAAEFPRENIGRVVGATGSTLDVRCELETECVAIPGRFRMVPPVDRPSIGDWVVLDHEHVHLVHILPRRTRLVRHVAGKRSEAQVFAANIDVVFVVTSMNMEFNPSRIERYLAAVQESGAQPVVVLNKLDLADEAEHFVSKAEAAAPGAAVVAASAVTDSGLAALDPFLGPGRTVVLVGSSGVGKSTIVNHLAGETLLATADIREDDDEGRHTTTARHLLVLPRDRGILIDTPGIRELTLWGETTTVDDAFGDVQALAKLCRFRDCGHEDEPSCAVRAAVEAGELSERRLRNYRKLRRELAHLQTRTDVAAKRAQSRSLNRTYRSAAQKRKHLRGE